MASSQDVPLPSRSGKRLQVKHERAESQCQCAYLVPAEPQSGRCLIERSVAARDLRFRFAKAVLSKRTPFQNKQ